MAYIVMAYIVMTCRVGIFQIVPTPIVVTPLDPPPPRLLASSPPRLLASPPSRLSCSPAHCPSAGFLVCSPPWCTALDPPCRFLYPHFGGLPIPSATAARCHQQPHSRCRHDPLLFIAFRYRLGFVRTVGALTVEAYSDWVPGDATMGLPARARSRTYG